MISPLASVDSTAKIGKNVTIQPFAYIEGDVEIGDDCVIMSNASILKGTRLGKGNKVHHGAVLIHQIQQSGPYFHIQLIQQKRVFLL